MKSHLQNKAEAKLINEKTYIAQEEARKAYIVEVSNMVNI